MHDSLLRSRRDDVVKLVQAYDIVADRIERCDSASAMQWISFLPLAEAWPDSVFLMPLVSRVQKPSEVLVDSVKQWLRRRTLLKRDVKSADLLMK